MQTNHITTHTSKITLLANGADNSALPPNARNTYVYLKGKLITKKNKPHDLHQRTRPKKMAFRRFCTATIAGKTAQVGEV
jgi:hypothetical protein